MGNTGAAQTAWLDQTPWDTREPAQEDRATRRKATLFKSFTFPWWQVGLLKLSLLALGVVIGSTWPEIFVGWRNVLVVLFVVPAFYVTYLAFRQR